MYEVQKLLNTFELDKSKPIITAVSGGLDSMVLLTFLLQSNYKPIVVHFNHNTRDTNEDDELLIKHFCKTHHLKCYVFDIKISNGNFQSEARNLRYKHLKDVAKKYRTPYIATAHHLDDLAETILIKITRGSNLYGYAGIHAYYEEDGYKFIKPLLNTTKEQLLKYQKENEIPNNTDESNYTDSYLRNRYRHTVVPILKQENKQFLSKIRDYHEQLSSAYSYINKVARTYITNNTATIATFFDLDEVIQNEIIMIMINDANLTINKRTLMKIKSMLLNDTTNNSYNLKNGYQFIKAYGNFYIKQIKEPIMFNIELSNTISTLPDGTTVTIYQNDSKSDKKGVEICYNTISLPLIARTRKAGDTLSFKYGSKKLKDFLIDQKVEPHLRKELWLITDSNNVILWVSNDIYINETLGNEKKLKLLIGENL